MAHSNCSLRLLIFTVAVFAVISCTKSEEPKLPAAQKVIIVSDMVESFDDGIAMMISLASPNIEVLGVTTVTGNNWAQEGLAYAIRQGEIAGAVNVTFIAGNQYPLRPGRLETFDYEVGTNPGPDANWRGAVSYPEVTDWRSHYQSHYRESPVLTASSESSAEFIARQINAHPGEVSILSIGPCTSIAEALTLHPEIASRAKEIVYMGGALYCGGNTTPYAEMNILYDPEAAAVCLKAPFPKQTMVTLDVCNTVTIDSTMFFKIYDNLKNEKMKEVMRNQYYYDLFISDGKSTTLVWDLISAVLLMDPDICSEYRYEMVDVDDNPSSSTYGMTYISADKSCQSIKIPLRIDKDKFWNTVFSLMGKY